jgi:hypothetical protein
MDCMNSATSRTMQSVMVHKRIHKYVEFETLTFIYKCFSDWTPHHLREFLINQVTVDFAPIRFLYLYKARLKSCHSGVRHTLGGFWCIKSIIQLFLLVSWQTVVTCDASAKGQFGDCSEENGCDVVWVGGGGRRGNRRSIIRHVRLRMAVMLCGLVWVWVGVGEGTDALFSGMWDFLVYAEICIFYFSIPHFS